MGALAFNHSVDFSETISRNGQGQLPTGNDLRSDSDGVSADSHDSIIDVSI